MPTRRSARPSSRVEREPHPDVSAGVAASDPTLRRVVWKDPFAAFLVPELSTTYQMPVVITGAASGGDRRQLQATRLGLRPGYRVRGHLQRLTPGAGYLDVEVDTHAWANTRSNAAVNGAILWQLLYGYLDETLGDPDGRSAPVVWAETRTIISSPQDYPPRPVLEDRVALRAARRSITSRRRIATAAAALPRRGGRMTASAT